jgi:intein/homing endonuclease
LPLPKEGLLLYDKNGNRLDIEELVNRVKADKDRVLVDDEKTLILDLTGLDIYTDSLNFETGKKGRTTVTRLCSTKISQKILRLETYSGAVIECTKDTILFVRGKDGTIKQIRADKLKRGMEVVAVLDKNGKPNVVVY